MNSLGCRDVDLAFDYDRARNTYKKSLSYYTKFLQEVKKTSTHHPIPYSLYVKELTPCQRSALKLVHSAINDLRNYRYTLTHLSGGAGVGKSQLFLQ